MDAKTATQPVKAERKQAKAAKLTDRDRQLLCVVGEARYLSAQQLKRLFFAGRHVKTAAARLVGLERGGLLERHLLRNVDRPDELCWCLAVEGAALVESWTGDERVVAEGLHLDALEHHLFFAELYVGLLEGPVARRVARLQPGLGRLQRQKALGLVYASAEHSRWRWQVGQELNLPWREYVAGATKDRLIRPDALLEVPASRLRVFVEGETGSQPLRSRNPDRHGATTAKLARYAAYVTGLADAATRRTWYQQRFPDGFAVELLLLVPPGRRATNVRALVDEWSRKASGHRLTVRALTVDEAVRHYGSLVGVEAPVAEAAAPADPPAGGGDGPRIPVTAADVQAMSAFFTSMRADLKRRQAAVELAQKQQPGKRLAQPVVPEAYEAMKALVARLSSISELT